MQIVDGFTYIDVYSDGASCTFALVFFVAVDVVALYARLQSVSLCTKVGSRFFEQQFRKIYCPDADEFGHAPRFFVPCSRLRVIPLYPAVYASVFKYTPMRIRQLQ